MAKSKLKTSDTKGHVLFLEFISNYYFFWLCCVVCGILVPQPGIEPVPPAVEVDWTTREVLKVYFLNRSP